MMSQQATVVIGLDIGGTRMKCAAVDLARGELASSRHRAETPTGARPTAVAETARSLIHAVREECEAAGLVVHRSVGVCVPSVVRGNHTMTAANIDPSWVGLDAVGVFRDTIGAPVVMLNDADAAAEAELAFGAARGHDEKVIVLLTFGTGIGSGLIHRGRVFPRTELGHLDIGEIQNYEQHASPKRISDAGVSFAEWADRVATYVRHIEVLFSPDRVIVGGSISTESSRFLPLNGVTAEVVPARFRNNAGIIGAAHAVAQAEADATADGVSEGARGRRP